jgi:bifunctional non-homologous end joining protein LigD
MAGKEIESTCLYYRAGSSDKVYRVALVEHPDGTFSVNAANGRRGGTLVVREKKKAPTSEKAARAVYDKTVSGKLSDGYQPGGEIGSHVPEVATADVLIGQCQLLNPVEPEEAKRMMQDDRFLSQQKHDGKRLLVGRSGDTIFALNRKGKSCGFPAEVAQAAARVAPGDFLLDGELVGEVYHVFDALQVTGADIRSRPYTERHESAGRVVSEQITSFHVQWVPSAVTTEQKQGLHQQMLDSNAEGVVYKRKDAPYTAGRPASGGDQFKHKFVETCSARVAAQNDKRSVALEMMDDEGAWVFVGNVTVPQNQPIPDVREIVEVEYLYAFPNGGSLFQPVLLGRRDDLAPEDCTTDQLKLKTA